MPKQFNRERKAFLTNSAGIIGKKKNTLNSLLIIIYKKLIQNEP
jgi:hypothetical protein